MRVIAIKIFKFDEIIDSKCFSMVVSIADILTIFLTFYIIFKESQEDFSKIPELSCLALYFSEFLMKFLVLGYNDYFENNINR